MRNCPKCNVKVLDDDAKFCIECGASLKTQLKFFPAENIDKKNDSTLIQTKLTTEERKQIFNLAKKNYPKYVEKLFELAKAGDAEAMYFAYKIELNKKNISSAKEWLQKSATGGYVEAMCDLADNYTNEFNDFDFPQDYDEVFKLYEKVISLDENNFRAENGLAKLYYHGRGVEKNYIKALECYEKSAVNYYPALIDIGNMYYNGDGVAKDEIKALEYYLQADNKLSKAENPNFYYSCQFGYTLPAPYYIAKLKFSIAGIYRHNSSIPTNLELSDKFYRQAFDIYSKLETNNNEFLEEKSSFDIGLMYYNGYGVERNYWMAINYFQRATDAGNSDADVILKAENGKLEEMDKLRNWYASGNEFIGIEKDSSKAEYWAKKVAQARKKKIESEKPMSIKEIINELYSQYGSLSNIYFYGKSDKAMRKINNAIEAYAQLAVNENIIFLYDDTNFGSARDGFLISDKQFYCHNIGDKPQFVLLENVQSVEITQKYKGMRCLKITDKNSSELIVEMATSTDSSTTRITKLVKESIKILSKQLSEKNTESNSKNADTYYDSGNNYANMKQYDIAIQNYTKALELNPNYVNAYINRGLAYSHLQQYERAVQDYDKAIEINPNIYQVYFNRGSTYMNGLKQYEKAIMDFNKALEFEQNDANVWYNRGIAYHNQQQYDQALQDYSKAIKLDPDFAGAYYNRGILCFYLNRHNQALYNFDRYIQLTPNDCDGWQMRGKCYQALNDEKNAQADFDKAKKLGYKE